MPLRDHFHPPLTLQYPWDSFHSSWATRLADALNDDWLPPEYLAVEHTHIGTHLEIDVAALDRTAQRPDASPNGSAIATLPRTWMPTAPARTMSAIFPIPFEVRVFSTTSGLTLVGAIELISPANKDRADERRAFATKCASYLYQGVSVVILDIVTNRRANLHNETMRLMQADANMDLPPEITLYGVAYRPVCRDEQTVIDVWTADCAIGAPLPTLPLRLNGDLFVPIDFETTYQEACRRRRIP